MNDRRERKKERKTERKDISTEAKNENGKKEMRVH